MVAGYPIHSPCGVVFLLALCGQMPAQQTHPFSVHDMVSMERISDPQVSPDAAHIVFVRRTTDLQANCGRTDVWLVNTDGSGLRRLTSHVANDTGPRWAADGRAVWFLSARGERTQIWRIAVDGGEATQVTDLPLDVGSFVLSRDGQRVALSMEVFPGATPAETKQRLEDQERSLSSGRLYDRVFIRHWDAWKDGRRSHVFVMPAEGGEAVDVMQDMDADCPTKPFGSAEDYTFTPDGQGIVFCARDAGREEAWSTNFDLFLAPIDGRRPPRNLTTDDKAWDANPVFSPNGRTLAYTAMQRPGYEADKRSLVLMDWRAAAEQPGSYDKLPKRSWELEFSMGHPVWFRTGRTIYTAAAHRGQRALFAINVQDGQTRAVVEQGTVSSVREAGDLLLFGLDHLKSPVELYSARADGGGLQQITRINADRLSAVRMGDFEQFRFNGWRDQPVYGYVMQPVDFDPSRQYPVTFLIHGGPQGSFGNHFHYRWNPQAYAGHGYGVVFIDFHGSTGYGQEFVDSIRGDWGGKPLVDLQKGLAAALEQYPWLDGDNVAALGASYGGYMIYWIAGNWSERFRCLVSHDGVFDTRFMYYDTEELWFPEWDHLGTPWEAPGDYARNNPAEFVGSWQTPMLVIHGAKDYRVTACQGMAAFNALQRRGVPSKFLYYPDENHWVLKPHNSIQWHDTVLEWLDLWTKQTAGTDSTRNAPGSE